MNNLFLKIALIAAVSLVAVSSCGNKKEEDNGGDKTYNLTSNLKGKASIFSNAGSKVEEVTFSGQPAKVTFPGTSTRLIGVIPALGISEGRASSVRMEIPASQKQFSPGKDELEGGFFYSKAPAADDPVRFDFAPMGRTFAVTVKGPSSGKIRGIVLSNQAAGITGVSTMDLFKNSVIPVITGGGKQVSVTLQDAVTLSLDPTLYLHTACVKLSSVQFKVILADCYWQVTLSPGDLDLTTPGETAVQIDLEHQAIQIDGAADPGATFLKSGDGDFSSLLLLDDEDTNVDYIPDFSRVGYKYGDAPIPSPAVVATINVSSIAAALNAHTAADTTDYIQQVIDRVGSNGGGAILFKNGTYNVGRILFLDHSNVVLRGESEAGTIIKSNSTIQAPIVYMGASMMKSAGEQETESIVFVSNRRVGISKLMAKDATGTYRYIVTYTPRTPGRTYGSNSVIIEDYVPVGRLYVEVRNPNLFKPGDQVCIYRQPTQSWLDDIGMTHIANGGRDDIGLPTLQWDISGYTFRWSRKVTAVQGSRVYLDAPVVQSLETRYGGGELQKYSWTRISECGVENMTFDCKYDASVVVNGNQVDECHAWRAVLVKSAEHCWVRNVTCRHMAYSLADMGSGARCITVEKCTSLSPISAISGARRYAYCFSDGAELCLVKDCYCEYDRHSYVTNGPSLGPNVFTNCKSEHGYATLGPHWGWATGTLYDDILADSNFEAQDGGNQGRGHGWRGMCTVFWNVATSAKVVCQNAWGTCPNGHTWNQTTTCSRCGATVLPSGRNYAVGVNGYKVAHTVYWEMTNTSGVTTNDFFLDMYGYGPNGENRPDGCWYPERAFNSGGGEFIALPYEAPVSWWPRVSSMNYAQPYSLYQCQLEDRHAHGIYLNTL